MQYFIQYFNWNPFRSHYPTFSLKYQDLSTCHFNLFQKNPVFLLFLCLKKKWELHSIQQILTSFSSLRISNSLPEVQRSRYVQIRGAQAQVTTYLVNVPAELFLDSGGGRKISKHEFETFWEGFRFHIENTTFTRQHTSVRVAFHALTFIADIWHLRFKNIPHKKHMFCSKWSFPNRIWGLPAGQWSKHSATPQVWQSRYSRIEYPIQQQYTQPIENRRAL